MLSYREVMYVVSAAQTGSFARAAEVCYVSQPSLSIQIKKVEDRLGAHIFIRSVQGVQLTPFGRDILPRLEDILTQFETLKTLAEKTKQQKLPPLRLGIIPTVGPYLLPQLQGIKGVNFVEGTTETLVQKLLANSLDGAILALPVKLPKLKSSKLLRDVFYLVAAENNPHAAYINTRTMQLPPESAFLVLSEEHCLGEQTAELCRIQQSGMNEAFRATSLETIRQMVAKSHNVTLMPAMAKRDGDGLVYYTLAEKFYRDIGLVYKKDTPRLAEVRAFEQNLQAVLSGE